MDNKDELYHYGVKGMKWKGHVYATKDELKRAKMKYKYDKLENNMTGSNREWRRYVKKTTKDLKKAQKLNDETMVKRLLAGRTLAKMVLNDNYANMSIVDAAKEANVKVGENFIYNMRRNDKAGTVDIRVKNKTSSYVVY